ncbi:MAG: cytochrome-c peroxidase [Bacteroidia bacterium]
MKARTYLGALLGFLMLSCLLTSTHRPQPFPFPSLYYFPTMPTAADNPVTIEGAELGRYLFYETALSRDSTIACATCHRQSSAFSDAPKRKSLGIYQDSTSRNTLPLFNLAWYPALFWDGKATNLENVAFHPIHHSKEMDMNWKKVIQRLESSPFYVAKFQQVFDNQGIDSIAISKAIAQFLRTLLSYQSKYDKVLQGKSVFDSDEYQGFVIVNDQSKGACLHCHTTDASALGTNLTFSDNGLDNVLNVMNYPDKGLGGITGNPKDLGKFKTPSLRNLSFTAPYMHDGRFSNLEEVLRFYNEEVHTSVNLDSKMTLARQKKGHLNEKELNQVLKFLLTLNDSTFVTNPIFGKPSF